MKTIWKFFCSTTLTVILALVICVVAGWGSIVTVNNRHFFEKVDRDIFLPWLYEHGADRLDLTFWIYILVVLIALFGLNTFVCTLDKLYRIVRLGLPKRAFYPQIIHIGFLIALLGHLVGSAAGFRSPENILIEGKKTPVPHSQGLVVRLDKLNTEFGPRGPEKVRTTITLFEDGKELRTADISVNSPVIENGIAFYHEGQGQMTRGLVLNVDGEQGEVEFGRAFALGGRRMLLGTLYPDYAVDPSTGQAYSRSNEYRNPVQVVMDAGGEQGLLRLGRPGTSVVVAGATVSLVGYATTEYAVIAIHKDPGIWLIIIGSLILVIGMILLLFAGAARGEGRELMRRKEVA
ncbi:hypothetical protein MNBD_DELTA01-1144 [hydrothermal vent metagenome]|uniref:ResB-like domain-containing protein n=1 Tax=hydrothermal vent metagenome TaxID=652676 RepID=A0A3B0QR40_9ZZZZ